MITAELLPAAASLEELKPHWDRLFGSRHHQPSVGFEWSQGLVRNHLAGSSDWFIVLLRRADVIVGIIPMMTRAERLLGRSVTTLQPIQELYKTHGDLLLSEPSAEAIGAWLQALRRADRRWDLLRMSRILERGELAAVLQAQLPASGLGYRLRTEQPSFHLNLPSSFGDYLEQRSSKFRNYLKRAEKKLQAPGSLELIQCREPSEFARHYDELLEVERGSWKHAHGTAISAVRHQSGFYRDLCESALQAGMLHLTFLRLQARPIAYNLGLVVGGCYFYLKTSHLDERSLNGAATVARARLIEALIGQGIREFDFPGEPYEWEQQWAVELRWHKSLLVYNSTMTARMISMMTAMRSLLRGGHDTRKLVFSDARALRAPEGEEPR